MSDTLGVEPALDRLAEQIAALEAESARVAHGHGVVDLRQVTAPLRALVEDLQQGAGQDPARIAEMQQTLVGVTEALAQHQPLAVMRKLVEKAAAKAGTGAAGRLAVAMAASWELDSLDDPTRLLWRAAFDAAADEGRYKIARDAGRVLAVDATARRAFGEGSRTANTLATLAADAERPREALLHELEAALMTARVGDHRDALERIDEVRKRTGETPDLDAYACFVAGEIFLLAGQPQKAAAAWSGVLQMHQRSPAPKAACRAAWMLARFAREMGETDRERRGLELALQTGLGVHRGGVDSGAVEGNVALVEQIALALGRRYTEDGLPDAAARVLAALGPAPAFARVRAAIAGGILAELD